MPKNTRPHIVIFNPDEYRGDVLGHMGNPAAVTPNLDNLVANDAVSFRNAFAQAPVCTPSRCSFMSGWYRHVRGHRIQHFLMQPDEPVLLKNLKDNGYFVWWGGKNDLIPGQGPVEPYCSYRHRAKSKHASLHSKDDWRGSSDGDNYYSFYAGKLDKGADEVYCDSDWDTVNAAIDFIKNTPKDQPLCIYLALGYPHPPYGVEEPWYSAVERDKIPGRAPTPTDWDDKPAMLKGIYERQNLSGWSEDRWRELRGTYYGMCARIDHQMGLVIEALKNSGLYDDTALFFFSDHGDFAGDYGLVEKTQNTFEDALTNVPFIVKPPAWQPVEPGVKDALIELVDFPATVEDLTGIKPTHPHFGRSLLPIVSGRANEHRDAVFAEGGRLRGETHCMELESTEAQVPTGLYWPRLSLQREEGPEHTKAVMCRTKRYKYVHRLYEKDELYDLQNDPQELVNRIDDPSSKDVLLQLKERTLHFFMETADIVPFELDRR